MKKRIRLTESQLHNVIKESVKRVISELDLRTILNAYKQRLEKSPLQNLDADSIKKYQKICHQYDDAIQRAIERQYPNREYYADDGTKEMFELNPNATNAEIYYRIKCNDDDSDDLDTNSITHKYNRNKHKNWDAEEVSEYYSDRNGYDGYMTKDTNDSGEDVEDRCFGLCRDERDKIPFEPSNDFLQKTDYNRAKRDLRDFYSGKSKYVDGKGWR